MDETTLRKKVRVDERTGCHEWTGYILSTGYGLVQYQGRRHLTHRLFYALDVGPILKGLHVDHLCENKRCVNVEHLEPVTPGENARRWGVRRTQCRNGHPYPENKRTDPRTGWTWCLGCHRDQNQKRRVST